MKMMKQYRRAFTIAAAMLFSPVVFAQDMGPFEFADDRTSLLGLGVVSNPDYYGASSNRGGVVPLARYTFAGGNRHVQLLGPELTLNLLDLKEWRAGPILRVRGRRDDGVNDKVVKRMRPIASATELGVFAAYHLYLDNAPLHKVVFSGDVVGNTTDVYTGATGNLRVTYFHPFSRWINRPSVGSIGLGLFFAGEGFNRTYFGVTGSDVALYPSRNGVEFLPKSGLTSVKIPFSVTTQLQQKWLLTVGGRYERLLGDAKDSPVVEDRGDPNQWALGFAFSYLF